jgi:hypothetical protein
VAGNNFPVVIPKTITEMDKVRDAFTHSFHYFKSQVSA